MILDYNKNMPKIYKRNCNYCGKYYEGLGEIYCSIQCFKTKNKITEDIQCPVCKIYFRPIIRRQRHCSIKCSWKNNGKNTLRGEKHPFWKGDNIGYTGLHQWISKLKPKTELCECCNKVPPIDLANIRPDKNKETYTRDLENWEWLCRKCHMTKDGRLKKFVLSGGNRKKEAQKS